MGKFEKEIFEFIDAIKKAVPQITNIWCEYDSDIDEYFIWHNLIPTEEDKHREILGNLIFDILYEREIYNISFAYKIQ